MRDIPAIARVPFWYLRHGETDWNRRGLSQGNVDIPLNELGLQQAREAAERLRGQGISSIVASPLSRARVTAEIVAETLGLDIAIEHDLREVSWGVQEGKEIADWFPGWIEGHATPEGGESFAALRHRVVGALNRAVAYRPMVLVVAHGAVFRALRSAMKLEMTGRTRNCVPMRCEPLDHPETPWSLAIHD